MGDKLLRRPQQYPVGKLSRILNRESQFLVDTAFIVERTSKIFFGTPLLTKAGKDHTFTFGFARDVLKLRQDLGMRSFVLLLGKEAHFHASDDDTEWSEAWTTF